MLHRGHAQPARERPRKGQRRLSRRNHRQDVLIMTFKVYEAIAAVQGELAKHGLSTDRENAQQGYNFRGIADVSPALSPLLAKHKLCVLPPLLPHPDTEPPTK